MARTLLHPHLWFLWMLILFSGSAHGVITLHDHSQQHNIGNRVEILKDPSGQLTFQQVQRSDDFVPSQQVRPSFGFSGASYWIRFRLANLSQHQDWQLQIRYAPLDYVTFYHPDPDSPTGYQTLVGGDLVLPGNGRRTQMYPQFPLLASEKIRTYYLHIESESSIILPMTIGTAGTLQTQSLSDSYFQGAYLGLMAVMALYNFFVFLVIRDRSYLYYTAFITCTGVFQVALHGYASVHFWPESLWWNNVSNLTAACLSVAFCGKFAQNFIQLDRYHKRLNTLLGLLSLLCFVIGGLSLFINYQLIVTLISIASIGVISTSLVAAAYAWRKGSRSAGYYLLAWLILLLFSLLHILIILGVLPSHPLTANSIQVGGAVEAVLLSMGLADRINTAQKQALAVAQSANKVKDDFMSTISHELLTPVNGVRLSLDLLKQTPRSPDDEQLLKNAMDSSTHLMNLIESMFHFVELRQGTARLGHEPLDLKWILTSVHDYFRSVNSNPSVHLYFSWDKNLPDIIMGDEKKLTSIIVELMKNAYAFTREGHITLAAQRIDGPVPLIEITVQDSGFGISREKLKRMFVAFEQADNSVSREHGGLGIGLTMIADILNMMGTRLHLESAPGEGTTAQFTFKLEAPDQTGLPRMTPRSADEESPPTRHRVLVVEDNPVNAQLLCKVLTNADYDPITASNGQQALDILDADSAIDAVLMDCQMPVMDGFQATRIIRRHHVYNAVPVIAITANISTQDRERCLACGMNEVLTKPVRKHQVEECLRRWLTHTKRPR